jgi:hypothetical protein
MPNDKNAEKCIKYVCDVCDFKCSKLSNYNKHLTTAKHIILINPNNITSKNAKTYTCICGKKYKHSSTLCKHKKSCHFKNSGQTSDNGVVESNYIPPIEDKRDELIERLVTSNTEMVSSSNEMKSMFQLLLEKYHDSQLQNQELMSKMIDVMPQMGNTTNNNTNSHNTTNNNTLNFYLTNTCKDAESIHDFTERFVKRSVDFFKGNYLDVAHNQIDLASNVYDIFKNCLDENPQTKKFVQTTDAKNGVLYIKEKQKDENKQLCGEAEFIKHIDGFEKAGTNISHAINCAFIPVQDNYKEIMERECGKEPKEDDYEDEDHYERDMDIYKEKTGDLKRHLLVQSFNAVCLFDAKKRRNEVLEKTRRLKE